MHGNHKQSNDLARQAAMAVLASAAPSRLSELWLASGLSADGEVLRGPETGLVMVRGRIGGGGQAFNAGDATVTRATVRLPSGEIGHSIALGRDHEKARIAATLDALFQSPALRLAVEAAIIAPLQQDAIEAEQKLRAETAATKVDFFTLVRGED